MTTRGDLLPRTGVWWDLNTCPVPGGFDPHCVRGSIESALTKYVGESRRVTICAVGNLEYVSAELLRAISKSGMLIKHTPCRMRSLFWLLREWSKHTPPPANILLISSDPSWFVPDSVFVPSGYIVHRAFPENHRPSLRPPSSKGEKWDWETLLKDNSKTSLSRPIDKPAWLCFICDMDDSFESCSSFVEHLKSEEHREELYHSVMLDEEGVPVHHCKLCNYPGYDEFNMNIHYNSAQHKQKVKENEEEEKIKNDKNLLRTRQTRRSKVSARMSHGVLFFSLAFTILTGGGLFKLRLLLISKSR